MNREGGLLALAGVVAVLAALVGTAAAYDAATASARAMIAPDVTGPAHVASPAASTDRKPRRGVFKVVQLSTTTQVARWPDGPVAGTVPASTPLGSPTWLWVVGSASGGRWLRVVLPWRPNGATGWIHRAGLHTGTTGFSVEIDLSRRRLLLLRRGRKAASYRTGIGAPASPTPVGRFSVTDRVLTGDDQGPFGWYAFGLSGHQPLLPAGWTGGDQLAIHGTNDPSSIGADVSAGCLRVSREALSRLRSLLRLGTPVVIHD